MGGSPLYKRILLKLSGEVLMGEQTHGLCQQTLDKTAKEISKLKATGVQIGIVIGGGNFLRGAALASNGTGRQVAADHIGMLATVMNSLALKESLLGREIATDLMAALEISGVASAFDYDKAITRLEDGKVMIFAGGTGNPFFTTDTAACLRGIEISADVVFKATKVDGVYDKDPARFADAKFYPKLDYAKVIAENLKVMDMTAIILCRQHNMPLRVMNMLTKDNLVKASTDENIGTLIT